MSGIPQGWTIIGIEETLLPFENKQTLRQGWSPQCERFPAQSEEDWGVLKTTAIQDGEFQPEHNKQLPPKLDPDPLLEVKVNDLLLTCAGPRVRCGVICLVRKTRPRLMISGKMYRFRTEDRIALPAYLEAFLRSHDTKKRIDAMKTGISDSGLNLTLSRFKTLQIPVPPPPEQKRIVAKIEELFSELDAGVANLKKARAQLVVYRQALLKHAFEGKLTAEWRAKHGAKPESADQLLASIRDEREAWYQSQLKDWESAIKKWEYAGGSEKRPSRPTKPIFGMPKVEATKTLPFGWSALEMEYVAVELVLGKMLDKAKNIGKPRPYLGNINVRWGTFDLESLKEMRIEDSEVPRYRVDLGDLVICEGGEPGRCAVWKMPDKEVFIQKALHRVRFTASYDSRFAYLYLTLAASTQRMEELFTGTTIKHLTGAGLAKLILPVCSIEEQREIISSLESQISAIHALESEIDLNLQKAEALRQSILKKAFAGELVPQDPADEPAAVLLARIRAEREAQAADPKLCKTRTKKA